MKFYEVTDKELVQECIDGFNRLVDIKNCFIETSQKYGFNGAVTTTHDTSSAGEFVIKGFFSDKRLTTEQAKNFKNQGRGNAKYALPKKHFVDQLKSEMKGFDFGETCHMNKTWNKFVKYEVYATLNALKCDRVLHAFSTDDNRVFVAIHAEREDANLNTDALVEIKKSEYLAFSGN